MAKGLSISRNQVLSVITHNPWCYGNNGKFVQAFYEMVCQSRDIPPTWENIAAIMVSDYKPGHVLRKRREYIPKTKWQSEAEYKYWKEYAHH
jgi:hypothetical protein